MVASGHGAFPSPAIMNTTGTTAGFNAGLPQSIGLASGAAGFHELGFGSGQTDPAVSRIGNAERKIVGIEAD